jgi:hypothetical protein
LHLCLIRFSICPALLPGVSILASPVAFFCRPGDALPIAAVFRC